MVVVALGEKEYLLMVSWRREGFSQILKKEGAFNGVVIQGGVLMVVVVVVLMKRENGGDWGELERGWGRRV